ncbi:uncharacterized protein A4U43_C08F4530 [Asparagus officinalis]|nr:uncharacterized protein A4U43_C08F4530 [Asparagus officinalis]
MKSVENTCSLSPNPLANACDMNSLAYPRILPVTGRTHTTGLSGPAVVAVFFDPVEYFLRAHRRPASHQSGFMLLSNLAPRFGQVPCRYRRLSYQSAHALRIAGCPGLGGRGLAPRFHKRHMTRLRAEPRPRSLAEDGVVLCGDEEVAEGCRRVAIVELRGVRPWPNSVRISRTTSSDVVSERKRLRSLRTTSTE